MAISKQQLIDEIRARSKQLGGVAPRPNQYKRAATVYNKFGTWKAFIKAAGIKATYLHSNSYITLEEIDLRMNRIIASGENNFTWKNLVTKYKLPLATILSYFGSLSAFLAHYNIDEYQHVKRKITLNEIDQAYIHYAKTNHGNEVTEKDLSSYFGYADARKITGILHRNGYRDFSEYHKAMQAKVGE